MILKIDPDFQQLIPPLAPEEFKQLEQNILAAGRCRDAIVMWKGYIVDGHNRYAVCQAHDVPFEVLKIHFESKSDALIWIAENQLGRRNLTDAMRIELACYREKMLRQRGKASGPINVRKAIAAAAGVGDRTVYKYMKIVGEGAPELVEQVRKGEVKIGSAFNMLKAVTKKVTVFYDDSDKGDWGSAFCYANVIRYVGEIERLYGFVGEVVGVGYGKGEMSGVRENLERQLGYIDKYNGFGNNNISY